LPKVIAKIKKVKFSLLCRNVKQKRNVRIKKEFNEFERVWFIIPFVYEINKVYFIYKEQCLYDFKEVFESVEIHTYICNFTTLFIILFRQQRKKLNIKKC